MSKDNNGLNLPVSAINELAEILKEQNLTEIEVENSVWGKIKVRRENPATLISAPAPAPTSPSAGSSPVTANTSANLFEVKSPMVGTFYASPSPDADVFVKVGARVKKGDTLCIIEAMKLMNELPSEAEGEIAEICVTNAQAISFGQVLMKIKKS